MIQKYFFPQAAKGGDLAYAEKHKLFEANHYAAQVKFDGARYVIHKDWNGRVRIYSRGTSVKTGLPPDKTMQLQHLADEFAALAPNGTVIDGEVVASGKSTFNLVTTVTGSKWETALEKQREHGFLQFQAFDILAIQGRDMTSHSLQDRHEELRALLRTHKGSIRHSGMHFGEQAKRKLYDDVIAEGGEGIILKDLTAPYHQGDRHISWVKVKVQKTYDVVFMGIELANETSVKKGGDEATRTRIAGLAGAIKIGQYMVPKARKSDKLQFALDLKTDSKELVLTQIGTCSGFDDAVRADITENHKVYTIQGRVLEVSAQGRFASGAIQNPRFKQWRDDKSEVDCVYRNNEG